MSELSRVNVKLDNAFERVDQFRKNAEGLRRVKARVHAYLLVPSALHDAGLREYIRQSHLMVSLGLSKKRQIELGLCKRSPAS